MDRALKILSALYATASLLTFVCLVVMVKSNVVVHFSELEADAKLSFGIGLVLAYLTMFVVVYATAARLIWRRVQWKKTMLLAAASCLGFPVGPVMGIAALILLTRPAVRRTFAA